MLTAVQELLQSHNLVVEFHGCLIKDLVADGWLRIRGDLVDALRNFADLCAVVLPCEVAVILWGEDVGELLLRLLVLLISRELQLAARIAHHFSGRSRGFPWNSLLDLDLRHRLGCLLLIAVVDFLFAES